ncbi:MAG: T9SS type A sorting domain-containing protein [Ignavibacteriales bacterium]|nr:T9SS type A sorting domain-containing protein [Ignavibacteriales bacterium]
MNKTFKNILFVLYFIPVICIAEDLIYNSKFQDEYYPLYKSAHKKEETNSNTQFQLIQTKIQIKLLFVEFQNVKHRNPDYPKNLSLPAYTYNDFNNLFFSENIYVAPNMYSPDGKEVFGSIRDYYRIMSNGNLIIEGIILNKDLDKNNIPDWICLDKVKSYYHENNGNIFRSEAKQKAIDENLDVTTNDHTFLAIIYAGHTYRKNGFNTLNPEAFRIENEYIMGERFVKGFPYEEERNDPKINNISHFSHIGIHVHEIGHLLGFEDLKGLAENNYWCLMSKGNYNGPNMEGECPAPINPYYRFIKDWYQPSIINEASTITMNYCLKNPLVYKMQSNSSYSSYFFVEFRKFDSNMLLGNSETKDYNSFIKNLTINEGILIWRKLPGSFIKLLYSSGEESENGDEQIFPGIDNVNVITPWSDSRNCETNCYWVPNTKPSENIGIEIIKAEHDNFVVELYQKRPFLTSPAKPKKIEDKTNYFVKLTWEDNLEPDISQYKIFKKKNDTNYCLYDSTEYSTFTDYNEDPYDSTMNYEFVFYKICACDEQNKESEFSDELKIPVKKDELSFKFDNNSSKINNCKLLQNFPNPFNTSTTIKYMVNESQLININVYDAIGNKILTLVNENKSAGTYSENFNSRINGKNLSSGIYFIRINTRNYIDIKKCVLLK